MHGEMSELPLFLGHLEDRIANDFIITKKNTEITYLKAKETYPKPLLLPEPVINKRLKLGNK